MFPTERNMEKWWLDYIHASKEAIMCDFGHSIRAKDLAKRRRNYRWRKLVSFMVFVVPALIMVVTILVVTH